MVVGSGEDVRKGSTLRKLTLEGAKRRGCVMTYGKDLFVNTKEDARRAVERLEQLTRECEAFGLLRASEDTKRTLRFIEQLFNLS